MAQITKNELETFRLKFLRCANHDVAPLRQNRRLRVFFFFLKGNGLKIAMADHAKELFNVPLKRNFRI